MMKAEIWVPIIVNAIVVIGSIFISNKLGNQKLLTELELQHKSERYHQLYLPLIKLLLSNSAFGLSYNMFQEARASELTSSSDLDSLKDPLVEKVFDNLQFASVELFQACLNYSHVSELAIAIRKKNKESREDTITKKDFHNYLEKAYAKEPEAEELFYLFVKQILSDAQTLAIATKEEDITTPLLDDLDTNSPAAPSKVLREC
ncbi:hypothetical protein [Lactiplantibacillus plantarum]|uniref:hypothetical protein n=1 Tax=Lactiplantibacillus plantarum TaxID=1590 RepID=UPI00077DF370|nr:hypothetical protein [Lactiplantibacillus plantarum]AXH04288.1 hypothetical protein CEB41_07330 [Lactiplantibacillus plantarum]KYK05504.1 hypothetical protein Lpl43_05975 [Lactiplantibacillus plantarum]MCT3236301.1 hypothetical protein [Lactiplantibacillus plantarum]